jgi:hypothetical protein
MKYKVVLLLLLLGCTRSNPLANSPCACDPPPSSFCVDPTTLRNFSLPHDCTAGCRYNHWDTVCQNGCAGASCIGDDPCSGVQCLTPPAAACVDPSTLRSYSSSGTCVAGTCTYPSMTSFCAGGCVSGACQGDACAGKICDQPPASFCVDGNTLRSYSAAGCSNGACNYAPSDTSCTCGAGACINDPCSGVICFDPPPPVCLSSTTLQTYDTFGTCSGGDCSYPAHTMPCPSNAPCSGGACQCMPQCGGKACGASDGCGGKCQTGSCSDPKTICQAGKCVCAPSCSSNAACGSDDGCGGVCLANCSGMCASACTGNSGCGSGTCWPDAAYLSDCVSTGCHALPCKSGYREIPACFVAGVGESTPLCLRNEITDFWTRPGGQPCPAGTHTAWMADTFSTECSSGPAPGGGFIYFEQLCLRDH